MSSAQASLDDLVCRGAAADVFLADQARLLLEELDRFVDKVNRDGVGVQFFANLQGILQRELILGLTRLYEPYSETHAPELRIPERRSLIDFLVGQGQSRATHEPLADEPLSRVLVDHLDMMLGGRQVG